MNPSRGDPPVTSGTEALELSNKIILEAEAKRRLKSSGTFHDMTVGATVVILSMLYSLVF